MATWQPRLQSPGQRLTLTHTTAPLLPGSAAGLQFSGLGQLGHFIAITADAPGWVSFYSSAAAREADGSRPITQDPAPGSGVLLDLAIATAHQTLTVLPGCTYFMAEATANPLLRALVRNTGSTAAAIAVTVTAVVLVP
jgi:hypothetical protein